MIKKIKKFGNSGHIIMKKKFIGKKAQVEIVEKEDRENMIKRERVER